MEQEYIIYIILAFLLGFLLKSLLDTNNVIMNNFLQKLLQLQLHGTTKLVDF